MQTNSNETKTLEKENVSSPSYFPVKGGHRGEGYRNDVKVKKKTEKWGAFIRLVCLLDNSFSPFQFYCLLPPSAILLSGVTFLISLSLNYAVYFKYLFIFNIGIG